MNTTNLAIQKAFRDRQTAMQWSRGLSGYQVAQFIAPYFVSGVNFRGCSKSHIFESLLGGDYGNPVSIEMLMERIDIVFNELGISKIGHNK